ncbi:MAG: hypothetical protein AAF502_25830, partial [Bacteroidota bacterium]
MKKDLFNQVNNGFELYSSEHQKKIILNIEISLRNGTFDLDESEVSIFIYDLDNNLKRIIYYLRKEYL